MPATIIERVIGGGTERAVQLSGGQISRLVTLPTGWSKVRLGIRFHMTDYGANLTGTPRFYFGFCSGVTNLIGSGSPTHFIGARSNAALWTREIVGDLRIVQASASIQLIKQVGTTVTAGAGTLNVGQTQQTGAGALAAAADRTLYFLSLTKGAPNYTARIFICNDSTIGDVSQATFLTNMLIDAPVVAHHIQPAAITVACDEAVNGVFNAVNVSWNRPLNGALEICDLAVSRLA